jgi:hypothetical protein
MQTYFVTWEIEVPADDPIEAAQAARALQLDLSRRTTVFDVFDEEGEVTRVDLLLAES